LLLIIALSCVPVSKALSLPSWLEPEKGTTPESEVKCYSIPYGGMGFASHLLTYYTVACLMHGRKPLWPTSRLEHVYLDSLWAAITFIVTVGVATFTIIRCQNEWEYMLIAIWKIFLSTMVVITTIIAPYLMGRKGETAVKKSAWCLVIYAPGIVIGFAGLGPLVKQNWHNYEVGIMTYALGGLLVVLGIGVAIYCMFTSKSGGVVESWCWGLLACVCGCGILAVLYSDWILGAIAGDLAGYPSSDNAVLFWTYFVAKRLPLLSI
jgi:hypothetical protein